MGRPLGGFCGEGVAIGHALKGVKVQRVQRVQKVHRVQRGRCPAPAGLEVMAACGGRLYRKVVFAAAQGEGGGSAAVYSPLP